jgi:hypothetical protein
MIFIFFTKTRGKKEMKGKKRKKVKSFFFFILFFLRKREGDLIITLLEEI